MKKLILLVLSVLAMCAGVTWGDATVQGASVLESSQEPANQVTKYHFKEEVANATFFYLEEEDCIVTTADVFATNSLNKADPGKPFWYHNVVLLVFQGNHCTGESYFIGVADAELPTYAFNAQGNLDSATLNAEVPVLVHCCGDKVGSTVPANINLSWTGNGPITKGKESIHSQVPGCKFHYTVEGDNRPAGATGTITVQDIQFILQPTDTATVRSSKVGQIEIGCE